MVRHQNAWLDTKLPYPACITYNCHYQPNPHFFGFSFAISLYIVFYEIMPGTEMKTKLYL